MFHEVDKDAVALLRVMKEHHDLQDPEAPLSEGTRLAPELVAERAGLGPGTLRYERAVRYLVREEALVWEERLRRRAWGRHLQYHGAWARDAESRR